LQSSSPESFCDPVKMRRRTSDYSTVHSPLAREVAEILDRLGSSADHWQARLEKLRHGRLLDRFLASCRKRPKEVAEQLGLRRVANLA
jgi:uncharacterized Zn finger protein